jgi:hypothetical protein
MRMAVAFYVTGISTPEVHPEFSTTSRDVNAKVRDLNELGSFRNGIASNWLLEADELLRIARRAGQVEHLGRPMYEAQAVALIDGVLSLELSRARQAPG